MKVLSILWYKSIKRCLLLSFFTQALLLLLFGDMSVSFFSSYVLFLTDNQYRVSSVAWKLWRLQKYLCFFPPHIKNIHFSCKLSQGWSSAILRHRPWFYCLHKNLSTIKDVLEDICLISTSFVRRSEVHCIVSTSPVGTSEIPFGVFNDTWHLHINRLNVSMCVWSSRFSLEYTEIESAEPKEHPVD